MGFLAKQILGISGFQIETKRVFSLASVLTTLWHNHLQMENLDQIIMVVKNWPNDPWLNYMPTVTFKDYMKVEFLTKENYDLIEEADF